MPCPGFIKPFVVWKKLVLSPKALKPSIMITGLPCSVSTVTLQNCDFPKSCCWGISAFISPVASSVSFPCPSFKRIRVATVSIYFLSKPPNTTPNLIGYLPPLARISKVNFNPSLYPWPASNHFSAWHSVTFKSYSKTTSFKSLSWPGSIGQLSSNIATPVLW